MIVIFRERDNGYLAVCNMADIVIAQGNNFVVVKNRYTGHTPTFGGLTDVHKYLRALENKIKADEEYTNALEGSSNLKERG